MQIEDTWKSARTNAEKILGKQGHVPDYKISNVFKSVREMNVAYMALGASKQEFGKKLFDLQNSVSKAQNALKDARYEVTDDDYDLNPKNPDDKKKIEAAKKVLDQYFGSWCGVMSHIAGEMADLERYLDHIGKFKLAKT